jgi:hypothetical protein
MDWNEEELLNDGLTDGQRRAKLHACDDVRQNQLLFSLALSNVWNFPDVSGEQWVRNNEQLLLEHGFRKEVIDRFCDPQQTGSKFKPKPYQADVLEMFKAYKPQCLQPGYSLDRILTEDLKKTPLVAKPSPVLSAAEKDDWRIYNLYMTIAMMSEEEFKEFQALAEPENPLKYDWDGLREKLMKEHKPSKPMMVHLRPDGAWDSVSTDPNCAPPPFKHSAMSGIAKSIYPFRNPS